jgi:hypothetical protein
MGEAIGCGHALAEQRQQAGAQGHARWRPPLLQRCGRGEITILVVLSK